MDISFVHGYSSIMLYVYTYVLTREEYVSIKDNVLNRQFGLTLFPYVAHVMLDLQPAFES